MPAQGQEEEREVTRGGADSGAQAFCVAVVGVAALDAHSGCSGSVPLCPLAERAERAGLHNAACLSSNDRARI